AYTKGMFSSILVHLLADAAVIPVVLIAAWALVFKIPKGKRYEAYGRILMAGLTAYLLAKFAAFIYQPETARPFEQLGVQAGALYLNNPGFPSDHALFVTAITAAVWFETRMKKTTILLAVLVVLICVGRVIAQVHTPLDVIGGIVIALIGALWYSNVPRKQEEHGDGKSHSKRVASHR
ncbi:MAG TPA: phosphatase PAP2 family protein, partial [Dongiaceae bacterium]|nr:phosphatase PAP2 family protein [Dongiaceae bacterium]